ncbi:MAG: laccase domain-containing protein, partial [Desulfarculus sp.]|nr:laccase domain-containing protein [Desulfarculus sp.]
MLRQQENNLPILRFVALAGLDRVSHAVTTRHGGVSQGAYASLNLGQSCGDDPAAVAANLERLRQSLGLERLVWARQVHGTGMLAVDGQQSGLIGEADGLATDQPGVGLLIKQADCQAVVLAAPRRGVVANLHIGWRGNVQNMARRGVEFLQERYGVQPSELWAGISPSLGPCCAEFVNHATELPEHFLPYRLWGDNFDLWQITMDQLTAAGVPIGQIEMSGMCSRCAAQFFSYRREGVTG